MTPRMDSSNITNIIQTALSESTGHDKAVNVSLDSVEVKEAMKNCFNATVFDQYIRVVVKNLTTLSKEQRREIEGDPLVYIIAVLIFYSVGIVILMINYMKKEQHEFEENNLYKQYVDKRDRLDDVNSRGRSLNRLALQALNAVNVISQDDQTTRVQFV